MYEGRIMHATKYNELDNELHSFIEQYVDSFIKWDLVAYFHYNAGARGTPEEIAGKLGRKTEDIKEALEMLDKKGLLSHQGDAGDIYFYQAPPDLKEKVTSFCEALEDRDKRLEILAKLLRLKTTR
jgi:DNA-binding MarR family transcriptional regulator